MTIQSILKSKGAEFISIDSLATVADAVALLAQKRIGALPVLEGGRVVGVFSERDVIYGLAEAGGHALSRSVGDVMTAPPVTVAPECPVLTALSLMTQRRIRHLPVVDAEALIGFVSIGDLVKFRIDRIEAEAEALRDYISS